MARGHSAGSEAYRAAARPPKAERPKHAHKKCLSALTFGSSYSLNPGDAGPHGASIQRARHDGWKGMRKEMSKFVYSAKLLSIFGILAISAAGCGEDSDGCIPRCEAANCGPDGCGGSCGACDAASVCRAGWCTPVEEPGCVPQCEGRTCGEDGCGGVCGTCAEGLTCQEGRCANAQGCVPQCEGRT